MLAYTSTEAIYIAHSFPKFPVYGKDGHGNSYSVLLDCLPGETRFGQNWFCLEMEPQTLWNLAGLLTIAAPRVIASRVNVANSNITLVLQNKTEYSFKEATFSFTTKGLNFHYLVKSRSANIDIYEDLIAPYFKTGFMTQTWGRTWMESYCEDSYEWDVENLRKYQIGEYWWSAYYDHSK